MVLIVKGTNGTVPSLAHFRHQIYGSGATDTSQNDVPLKFR